MLIIEQKRHGIVFRTIWYATEKIKKAGVHQYREAMFGDSSNNNHLFITLTSDLTESEDAIVTRYSKGCRYEVNRAPKEGIEAEMFWGNMLSQDLIERYLNFYFEFWKSKEVIYSDTEKQKLKNEMLLYAKYNALGISVARKDGRPIVYHSYILDGIRARLWHSVSLFRVDEEVTPKIVGFANRYLHKEDMLTLKKKGTRIYDWGGAGKGEDVINITKFKESFGGQSAEFYHFEETVGLYPKFFMWLAGKLGK